MLKFLTTIAVILWIVVGMAELVSLAPPALDNLPMHNDGQYQAAKCAEAGQSFIRTAICNSFQFIDVYHDDLSAFSAILIAIFTIILGSFTVSLARSTRRAANASIESSKALLASERGVLVEMIAGIVYAKNAYWADTFDNSQTMKPSTFNIALSMRFKNYGKTPTTIYDVACDIAISKGIPPIIIDIDEAHVIKEPTIAQNEVTDKIVIAREFTIDWQTSRTLVDGMRQIYFTGAVVYKDVFDNYWKREFIWEYNRAADAGSLKYEKTRLESSRPNLHRSSASPRGNSKAGNIY